ncbi:crosslink repair DNA glycosylase YcaQ family protein [Nonomuraea sp. NPDC046570]|uniref:winged helix-turn-helix domain-containing protein n=1 Tax=Nonomuraea sp. NPDC046570 TaxID=3155255 RepID=UPI003407D607
MSNTLTISERDARRLAVSSQLLDGRRPEGLWQVLQRLRCLQLDPINVVARSHELVLWSRLGAFDAGELDALRWDERRLFEYWAHAASIVLTEDYPLHQLMMRRYPKTAGAYGNRLRDWLEVNERLRTHILDRLRDEGPLAAEAFEDVAVVPWESSGWSTGRSVERMLDILRFQGVVVVAGRHRRARVWDLTERFLPALAAYEPLDEREVVARAAEHALRSLGVARPGDIEEHFIRGRYPGLAEVLAGLEAEGRVHRAGIEGAPATERWYVHADLLPTLERVTNGQWEPRTTLLSPFDNLICHRARTERLWNFAFRTEMYVPKAKRQYGYYILPILHGDRLIGRIAPRLDRRTGVLTIEGMYAEPGVGEREASAVAAAVADLARFVGAGEIRYEGAVPDAWRS